MASIGVFVMLAGGTTECNTNHDDNTDQNGDALHEPTRLVQLVNTRSVNPLNLGWHLRLPSHV